MTELLLTRDRASFTKFGASLALTASGTSCLVGEPASGCRAYLFKNENGTWVEKQILRGPGTVDGDGFGKAVSVSSGYYAV